MSRCAAAISASGSMAELHGWLVIDKPLGMGSTNVVGAVKRALREGGYAKVKVGHGGTLDPLASGVLPVALGEATKLAGRMLDASKVYDFTIGFGVETDTLDLEGQVVATSEVRPSSAEIEAVLPRFTGEIEQMPPAYSALKVDGARAYDLARAGEAVELATRRVTVSALEPLPFRSSAQVVPRTTQDGPNWVEVGAVNASKANFSRTGPTPNPSPEGEGLSEITLTAHVSKGTYIRSLVRDIAHALGTVGHVTMLRRTRAGPFDLSSAISLDILREAVTGQRLEAHLRPIEAALDGIPAFLLTPDQTAMLKQGRVLTGEALSDGLHFAKLGDTPVALVEAKDGNVRVERGFNL
jgi:tRNA pseudouridine55 synthase